MLCSTVVIFTIERKGDIKGGKGKSAKASRASVVPQTNWKQCVWKSGSYSGTDNGKIKVYVNGIRIVNNTLQRKFIPFQIIIIIIKTKRKKKKQKKIQEERSHSHLWNSSKLIPFCQHIA